MKVLKPGDESVILSANNGWYRKQGKRGMFKKFVCEDDKIPIMGRSKGCGAELEVSEKDLYHLYYYGTHVRHNYAAFKCAYCGKMNHAGGVPDEVWRKVKKKTAKFDGFDNRIY